EQLPVPTNIPDLLGFVTAFSPFAEISANRSFSGAPIVPMYQQNELPEDQYGPYTSETAKLIARGAAAVGLDETFAGSPRKIDHVVTGYGGSLGRYALQSADAALEALGAVERTPTPATGLEDKPGFKAVLGRPFGGTTDSI